MAPYSGPVANPYTHHTCRSLREFADGADWGHFNAAVSLHAHTYHSREIMADLPTYIARIPVVAAFFERELREHEETELWVQSIKARAPLP